MTAFVVTPEADGGKLRVMTPNQSVARYLGELTRSGLAATTRARYERYLGELADTADPYTDIADLSAGTWMGWLDRICAGKKGKPLDRDTISQRVTIAKQFSRWLRVEGLIEKDPLERVVTPRRKNPVENDNVVWLSEAEVRRMLTAAQLDVELQREPADKYRRLLCLGVLSYTGSRRAAVSALRIGDYDAFDEPHPTLAFKEKGGKFIKKPVAARLADLIREAGLAGVWDDPTDYLIPSKSSQRRAGERDARIIYKIVKDVAADAKVTAHVHAMRAAFACFFDEANPGQTLALKDLLGHSSLETTLVYLRRRNRQKGMAVVAGLDWGTDGAGFEPAGRVDGDQPLSRRLPSATRAPVQDESEEVNTFQTPRVAEPVGREPSFQVERLVERDGLPRETK